MFSIAVGFGVSTLVGTGLLLVMQMVEDFRDVECSSVEDLMPSLETRASRGVTVYSSPGS